MRLKELRKGRGMTQQKLASELSMTQKRISHYEIGDHEPNFVALIKIADYFDVSVDYLLGRTDNPKVNR